MEQAIKIAKTLRDIAAGLMCAVALIGAGFIGGVAVCIWGILNANYGGYSKTNDRYAE